MPTPDADVPVPDFQPAQQSQSGKVWRNLALGCIVIPLLLVAIAGVLLAGGGTEQAQTGNSGQSDDSLQEDSMGSEENQNDSSQEELPTGAGETFTKENYSQLISDPDSYEGAEVDITGQLLGAPERQDGELAFQMWADPANLDWSTVVYFDDPGLSLNSDEYVEVTGTVLGDFEGENAFGGTVSAVGVQADTVVAVDPVEAVDPAEIEVDIGNSLTDQGFSITVDRIEFAENSTRVYVTLLNETDSVADFYSFDSNIVQGSGQIDQETPFDYELEEPQSSISPGVETSGAIVYGPVDPSQPFDINFEWSSRNFNITPNQMTLQISAN